MKSDEGTTAPLAAGGLPPLSEDEYRHLVECAPDVVFVSVGETVRWISPAVHGLLGWRSDELIGGSWDGLLHPEERAKVVAARAGSRDAGAMRGELRLLGKDGRYVWLDVVAVPFADPGGRPALCGTLRYASGRRHAEQAQAAYEGRLRAAVDSMLDPHVLLEPVRDAGGEIADFRYVDANAAACEYNGVARDELIGATVLGLMPGHDAAGLIALYRAVVETGEPLILDDFSYEQELHGGHPRFYDIRAVRAGESISYTWRDVTARHQAAATLAASEAALRAIVEGAAEGINMLDLRTGRYVFMSPRQVELTGFTIEEMNDLPVEEAYERCHPDDREVSERQQQRIAAGETELSAVEYRWKVKSGEYRWFRDSRRVLPDEDGRPYALIGVSSDITERKLLEQELRRSREHLLERTLELEAANEELRMFAGAISHDMRGPLRAIDGFSEMVLQDAGDSLDDAGRERLMRVRAGAQRLGELMDALVALSRLSQTELALAPVDLSAMAARVLAGLARLEPERVVRTEVAAGCVVLADRGLMEVALGNLLHNAWKFTSGRAEAHIAFGEAESAGERTFFVRDDGAGFDGAYADKLFRPFERLHAPADFPGTGTGLAAVRRIVTRLGGRCWAEGSPDGGATFSFTLPGPPDGGAADAAAGLGA